MRLRKIILSVIVLFIATLIISCNSMDIDDQEINNNHNNEIKKEEAKGDSTSEEYKEIITENYEKYIVPIELDEEFKIEDIVNNEDELDNIQMIEKIRKNYIQNKNNISSFKEILKRVKLDNSDLQRLNNTLVNESENLIYDIDTKLKQLEEIKGDETIKNLNKNIFISNLNNIISSQQNYKLQFENTLSQIDELLKGINEQLN